MHSLLVVPCPNYLSEPLSQPAAYSIHLSTSNRAECREILFSDTSTWLSAVDAISWALGVFCVYSSITWPVLLLLSYFIGFSPILTHTVIVSMIPEICNKCRMTVYSLSCVSLSIRVLANQLKSFSISSCVDLKRDYGLFLHFTSFHLRLKRQIISLAETEVGLWREVWMNV